MEELEQTIAELESVKQSFKSNINSTGVSTSGVEFRSMPNLVNQLEKKLPTQTKSVTPSKSSQSVSPDTGYKLTKVEVGAIPDNYIEPTGTLPVTENGIKDVTQYKSIDVNVEGIKPTGTLNITKNDTYDVTNYASAEVNVPSKEPVLQEKTATPTKETQEITPDEGYDGIDKMTINPIPEEYIIPEGTLEIRTNGKHDVTEVKEVDVSIINSGDANIIERDVYAIDLSSGKAVITPSYSEGGDWDLSKVDIKGHIYYNEANNTIIFKANTGYESSQTATISYSSDVDTTLYLTYYTAGQSHGNSDSYIVIGKEDIDITNHKISWNAPREDFVLWLNIQITRQGTVAIPITKGDHFIMIRSQLFSSYQTGDFIISELKTDVVSETADAMSKVTINKPNGLRPDTLIAGNTAFGIKGTALGAKDVIEGNITDINDATVTSVAPFAFYSKSAIKSIDLPNCLSIGSSAFYFCSAISSISLPACQYIDGCAFYNNSYMTVAFKSIDLPECSYIGDYAFQGCDISQISVPKLLSVSGGAFMYCNQLTEFNAPMLTNLGGNAFSGCSSLTTVNLPQLSRIGGSCFYSLSNLETLNTPNVTRIDKSAIINCTKLSELNFPNCSVLGQSAIRYLSSVTSINMPLLASEGGCNFQQLTALSYVELPELSKITTSTFDNCSNLTSISFPKLTSTYDCFNSCWKIESIDFPEVIYFGGFRYCSALSYVNLPKCSQIYGQTLMSCSMLQSVSIPVCTSLGSRVFASCQNLKSIDAPMCTYLGSSAFQSCHSLEQVNLPVLPSINNTSNFYALGGLVSVNLPMCSTITGYTFQYCTSLKDVNIPICTSLGNNVFYQCSQLSSINLPAVSYIGNSVCYNCNNLTTVIIGTSNCSLGGSRAFYGTPMYSSTYTGNWGSIYVPADYVESYKTRTNWTYYASRITSIENLPTT